jgi:NAD(P)H-flavin reductase
VHELSGRITSVRIATPTTRIVKVDLEGQPFDFRPGQAALIGPEDADERVPFSIASAPEEFERDGHLEFLIKTTGSERWGTNFERLARGKRLGVRGPAGRFVFSDDGARDRPCLFIGGGTGIAPLRSMIVHAICDGHTGPLRVLYSARTPDDFAYARDLRALARQGKLEVAFTATREATDRWRGHRGRIAPGQVANLIDDPATLCYVCGPAAMVDEVPKMLRDLGVDAKRIRIEEW